ncbi:MAG: isochorismatase family cysteine hydrolase [Pseudonocardiales bacterium]
MNLSTSALIVVDVQNGFVRDQSRHVVPPIVHLVEEWKNAGGDVVFTRYINYENSPYERLMGWTRMRDAPETELVAELAAHVPGSITFDKTIYSLFTDEGATLVDEHGWTDLVICGIATEACVCKTAVDAFERNLTPWVVTDACASHAGQEAHAAGLLVTSRFIGHKQLITSDDLLEQTLRVPA